MIAMVTFWPVASSIPVDAPPPPAKLSTIISSKRFICPFGLSLVFIFFLRFLCYFVTPRYTQVTHLGVTPKALFPLGFKVCVTLVTPFFYINKFFMSCVCNPCTHNFLNINYMSKWVLQVLQVLHFFLSRMDYRQLRFLQIPN